MSDRRAEYDVTNQVKVTEADGVIDAIKSILGDIYDSYDQSLLSKAIEDFDDLFDGRYPHYRACDTLYHDKQHTLDMTLALARFISGHDRSVSKEERIGPERAVIGIITALYHDSGYIRREDDTKHHNGAEYTLSHVTRGSHFLSEYFEEVGDSLAADVSSQMIHYTGYEKAPDTIELPDRQFHTVGHMLGSADLMAQMSDRCYLEKCRDRLYPEFVIGGLAIQKDKDGNEVVIYASPEDLLSKTSSFYKNEVAVRLDNLFNKVYEFERAHFDGEGLYDDALKQNQSRLQRIVSQGSDFSLLRRTPPENYGTRNFPGLEVYLNQHPHLLPEISDNLMPQ